MTDLSELKFLECCFREALRLMPPISVLARMASQDDLICGKYAIRKGETVLLSIFNMANLVPNPEKFDPERWVRFSVSAFLVVS